MTRQETPLSPPWGTNTKLVVALTIVVILGALLVKFQFVITPLLMAFMLSYLFHPIADFIQRKARFSWAAAVGIIYLVVLIILLGGLTAGGVGLVQQIQSLVATVQRLATDLPHLIERFSHRVYQLGPFSVDFQSLDLEQLSTRALEMIQPFLSQTGTLLSSVAGGAANFLGWTFFVIMVSYFVLAESGGMRNRIFPLTFPGYTHDVERLTRELGRIWNAFLRGQIILFLLAVVVYFIVLATLGVHYAIGLAFVAGLARFVPYVGPAINWALLFLISYFQTYKLFGLAPLHYSLIVLVIALLIDQVFDNLISPRILSDSLRVHPAAVLVAAIVAANLLGLLGVVIAAPIFATVALFWRYIIRKMLDLDPWPPGEEHQSTSTLRLFASIRSFFRKIASKFKGVK